jgi:hypothetical protein
MMHTEKEVAATGRLVARQIRADLRAEFLRLLTEDSETRDRRRREFNQAIFDGERGNAVFNGTDLDMVMDKFDRALRIL